MAARKPKAAEAEQDDAVEVTHGEPEEIPATSSEPARALSPMEAMAQAMREAGMDDGAILAALNAQFGGGDGQGPAVSPGTPGAGEVVGPDPRMVAEYQERMKNYKPRPKLRRYNCLDKEDPDLLDILLEAVQDVDGDMNSQQIAAMIADRLDGFGGVELPQMFLEWCVQWQFWQATVRRLPSTGDFPPAKVLEEMVRYHWHAHPIEKAQLRAAQGGRVSSGPVQAFNPGQGDWSKN